VKRWEGQINAQMSRTAIVVSKKGPGYGKVNQSIHEWGGRRLAMMVKPNMLGNTGTGPENRKIRRAEI